jgi:hypothetical protein
VTTQLPAGDLTAWLGPDAQRIWATSFTVDEHEAFALLFRALGGKVPPKGVSLSFHRRAFRRAGQGVIPRGWLSPFDVPAESPLPTYHPKLILAEGTDRFSVVVSTANLATDDLRHTRNLAVHVEVSKSVAMRIAEWAHHPPRDHRALCLLAGHGGYEIIASGSNRSTLEQIVTRLDRCKRCQATAAATGEWIVAAPFWSPATVSRMLKLEPAGRIEAYFRLRSIWDQIGMALGDARALARRVAAYELRDDGQRPRWHHKVLGWRCCPRAGARSAFYLGSANATVCGLVGREGKAVNWEAGVLWLGGAELWQHARAAARAGFAAFSLGSPQAVGLPEPDANDELGPAETEELQRAFAAFAARCLRVNRKSRLVSRSANAETPFRVLGRRWRLSYLEVRTERHNHFRDLGRLGVGAGLYVAREARAQVRAVFQVDERREVRVEDPGFAEATLDLIELDPEPPRIDVTRRSSIAAALVGLMGGAWTSDESPVPKNWNGALGTALPSDVRFPFAAFFALRSARPAAAEAWLERLINSDEDALAELPVHWSHIAGVLAGAG